MAACPHPPDRLRPLFPARDYITRDAFEVVECGACGLALTTPSPGPDHIADYYPASYYASAGGRRFPGPVEQLQRLLYAMRARTVEQLAGGRPGRVLDIGCGPGRLLEAFRRRGWEVQGIELTDASAAHARDVLGIPVHVGPPEAWPWPKGHFDAVVLWHVLEHWEDPLAPLAHARRLLRSGGVVMVGVPNFGSAEARATRDRWFHLDVPRHVVHMTPRWLEGALGGAGFEVRRTSYAAPEYDAFSFVQSALNRLGLRHNLLYDLLRGRAAKVLGRPPRWHEVALSLAAAVPLAIASVPATALLALANEGSSVTMFAVKAEHT
jgi:SAM-dependent methyltransferase